MVDIEILKWAECLRDAESRREPIAPRAGARFGAHIEGVGCVRARFSAA